MTFGVRYGHGKAEGKKNSKRGSLHFELMLKVLNAEYILEESNLLHLYSNVNASQNTIRLSMKRKERSMKGEYT